MAKHFLLLLITCFWIECSVYNHFDRDRAVSFLKQFIKPQSLVFDVGANVGDKADVYISCGARVVCFEPQPACVNRLRARFSRNESIFIEAIGIAQKVGSLELMMSDQASTLATFNKNVTYVGRFPEHNYTWNNKVAVEVNTLDNMIQKYGCPDFCKIDVEGFELQVLKGLSQPINCISFECNSECLEQTYACIDRLVQLGYKKFNFCIGETCRFKFVSWQQPEQIKEKLTALAQNFDWSEIWGLWGDVYALYEA